MANRLIAMIATGVLLISAHPLAAQRLRGTVVLADSVTPANGVIVLATNESGVIVARTLTGERGEFSITLPAPGNFGLTALRIGFRPTVVPPLSVAGGADVSVKIVLNGAAITLTTVNVRAQDECRVKPDSGLMVARVWDEARKAILASQLRAEGAPLDAGWIEYDRTLDATARFVRVQQVRTFQNPTTHAFRSLPADLLASKGYVVADSVETMYYAPDADVLTSESFAATHCFQLVAPPRDRSARAGLIGVGFQPTRARDDVHDIEGTFWVDRATSELRSLEFRYTNLADAAMAAGAGGTVEFLRLADGNWLVSRWNVRMPRIGAPEKSAEAFRKLVFSASNQAVQAVHVTGGEVTRVTRHDTLVYEATGHALTVQLVARDTLVAAAGATLTLAGTDYAARADAAGRVSISPVLEGRYTARVRSGLMDSLGIAAVERDVEVRADVHVDSIALPAARDVLLKVCTKDSVQHGEGMLRGTVRDEHGRALRQAAVTVTWQGSFSNVNHQWSEQTLGVLTGDDGRWRICGVPRDLELAARVTSDSGTDVRTARLAEDQPFGAVDLVAHHGVTPADGRLLQPRALVELLVFGPGGAPLPGATLELAAPGGASRTVVTGPAGRALIPDVAPGLLRVRARRIGFKPGQIAVRVEAGRNTVP
ncbi:MAG: carboxypeptidase regulatory-like domain-containing protein, partial [Gemmatimonadales bacterium]